MTRTCVCSRCGSDKILIDAWGYWDAAKQQWALCDLLDDAYNPSCRPPQPPLFHRSRKRGIWSGIHWKPFTGARNAAYSAPNSNGTIGRSATICRCASA